MALERKEVPLHVSHWGGEDTSIILHTVGSAGLEPESPSKDSVMSDATTSASAVDVQMILGHEEVDLKDALPLPSEVVSLGVAEEGDPEGEGLPGARLDQSPQHGPTTPLAEQQQISVGNDIASLFTPASTLTPRRSPRAPNSAPNSGEITPEPKALKYVEASILSRPSPEVFGTSQFAQARFLPTPEHIRSSAFREGFISSAFPSPSLFQVTEHGFSQGIVFGPGKNQESSGHADENSVTLASAENLRDTERPEEDTKNNEKHQETDVNMDTTDGEQFPSYPHNADQSPLSPSMTKLLSTPLSHPKVPEDAQFPSSTPDLSTLFTSPAPQFTQPILSPFRLHQNFQSPPVPQPSTEKSSSPPLAPLATGANNDTVMSPVFPTNHLPPDISTSSTLSLHPSLRSAPQATPGKPSAQQMEDVLTETERKHEDYVVELATANVSSGPFHPSINHAMPTRNVRDSDSPSHPINGLQGSLTPFLRPIPFSQLPFPITPQRTSQEGFSTPVPSRGDLFAPIGDNPKPLSSSLTHASSSDNHAPIFTKIPVPVPTPGKGSSPHAPPLGSTESRPDSRTAQNSVSSHLNLLSPPTTLQLRQPSNLRNTAVGAASKIPRPGKKPYSKPVSRLPKLKVSSKPSTVSGVTPSQLLNPVMPSSPIKTRRRRADLASSSGVAQTRSTVAELPPDVIIYEPPAPRTRPKLESQEPIALHDQEAVSMDMDEEAISSRASPPVESGFSPPKSGLFLRNESRRLKEEVAANPLGSVIPQFSATAPTLGIFPSLSRPKGKGRNTLLRPMMMPLDPTSLRNLTTSNTLRNQHYVCSKVETKVILKEGKRPASPTTKVKTILEKKKEERDRSREERAARRTGNQIKAGGQDQEMTDSAEKTGSRKHPRGAGENEDYETPTKPERVDVDMEGSGTRKRKRVKWDKDLLQRFELDETNLDGIREGAELARARTVKKSCLATQVLLDPLGNVPQADAPIANLVKENVVVTRLIYMEDLPPAERPKRVAAAKANARLGIA